MRRLLMTLVAVLALASACENDGGGAGGDDVVDTGGIDAGATEVAGEPDLVEVPLVYQASGDPFLVGTLETESYDIEAAEDGPPVALRVFAPVSAGNYPLVQFQHGFLLSKDWYGEILGHLASHGFVVVAPQMYPADGIPLQKPTAFEEAATALALHDWLQEVFVPGSSLAIQADRVGLAGHSRGGKVSWAMLKERPELARAVAGVDPVDGEGGPLGGEERVLSEGYAVDVPALVLGTGLGPQAGEGLFSGACAPEGDNHEQFWAATGAPAWHVVATEHGHMDMLDELGDACGLTCDVCLVGPDPAEMRALTGGLLAAFFRFTLQDDAEVRVYLEEESAMPAAVTLGLREAG